MKLAFALTVTVLSFAGLQQPLLAQEGGVSEVMMLPIDSMTRPRAHYGTDTRLPLDAIYGKAFRESRGIHRDAENLIDADSLVDIIRNMTPKQGWDIEGASINVRSNRVVMLRHPNAKVLADAKAFVKWFGPAIERRIDFELWSVPASLTNLSGALTKEQTTALLSQKGCRIVSRLCLPSSVPGRVDSGRKTSFLADYDVEVAEESQIADPLISVLEEGYKMGVRGAVLTDGRIAVSMTGRHSDLVKLSTRDADSTWVGKVQLPTVDSMAIKMSGAIPNGGAMLVGAIAGQDDHFLCIRASTDIHSQAPLPGKKLSVFSSVDGIMMRMAAPLSLGGPSNSGQNSSGEEEGANSFNENEARPVMESSFISDLIRESVNRQFWDESAEARLDHYRDRLVVMAPAPIQAEVRNFLLSLEKQMVNSVGIEIRLGALSSANAQLASNPGADLAAVAGKMKSQVRVSALLGDGFKAVLGREQGFIKDHDVEIAQKATVADPIISSIFTGLGVRGRVSGVDSQRVAFDAEFLIQDVVGDVETVDGNANDIGAVDVPKTTSTKIQVSQTLDLGRWTVLRMSPLPGEEGVLTILVRATE